MVAGSPDGRAQTLAHSDSVGLNNGLGSDEEGKNSRKLYASRMRDIFERFELAKSVEKVEAIARRQLAPPAAYAFGVASRLLEPTIQRVGMNTTPPPAYEIVANYARGWLLFGATFHNAHGLKWHRFAQRAVITPETVRVPKRMREVQRRLKLEVRFDEDFETIMKHCREGRTGWLTDEVVSAFRGVYDLGFISTVGTYRDGRLVGGMWGMTVGRTLGIQSAFHLENHAGSLALVAVAEKMMEGDRWSMVDSVLLNDHYRRYGAREVTTDKFCELVWSSMLSAR
ncbi:MAG: aat [Acidimicrobiaceae bacterium]|nr:aat [Acidimicrobiaceae bacterium]